MAHDQRYGILSLRARMQEVDLQTCSIASAISRMCVDELRRCVDLLLVLKPIEVVDPGFVEILAPFVRGTWESSEGCQHSSSDLEAKSPTLRTT